LVSQVTQLSGSCSQVAHLSSQVKILTDPTGTSVMIAECASGGASSQVGALILSSAHNTQLLA